MSKSFSLLITGDATTSSSHLLALRFASAALEQGIKINTVFFYQQAVGIALSSLDIAADEPNFQQQWLSLAAKHRIPLQVCVAAAARRGLNEELLASLSEESTQTKFEIVGLGQLALILSQNKGKLIHFR